MERYFSWGVMALLLSVSLARAEEHQAYGEASDGNRPRCVSGNRDGNIFFTWSDSEKYERTLWFRQRNHDCSEWRAALGVTLLSRWRPLPRGTRTVFGVTLSDQTLRELEQVRRGANAIHEDTADEYLRNHPISEFSVETNRWLATRFGKGFAGEIYKAWLEQKPHNREYRRRVLAKLSEVSRDPDPVATLRQRAGDVVVAVALGLGMDASLPPGSDDTTRGVVTELPSYGIQTVFLRNDPYGDIWSNLRSFRLQLDELLDDGKDVILMGLSKGSVELLHALSASTASYQDSARTQRNRPSGRGRVLAFLGLSTCIGGSYLADALVRLPYPNFLPPLLQQEFGGNLQRLGRYLAQVETMTTGSLDRLRAQFIRSLPSDLPYLNAVGIHTGNGLRIGEHPKSAAFRAMDRTYGLTPGAHDGLLEYPKVVIPDEAVPDNTTVVFEASHALMDGSLGPYSLTTANMRQALFTSLFLMLLERH